MVAALAVAGAMTLAAPHPAHAHAVIPAGQYRVAIGWAVEPSAGNSTYLGEVNAIQVFIDKPMPGNDVGTPVDDLNHDCSKPDFQVTVKVGNTTSSPYCPAPAYDGDTQRGRQDEYDYPIRPTAPGNYTFHIFGTIHGVAIDRTIDSGASTFDSVADISTIDFPNPQPPLSEVATAASTAGQRAVGAVSSASSASSAATTALLLGGVGIVLGLAALSVAVLSLRRRT